MVRPDHIECKELSDQDVDIGKEEAHCWVESD